MRLEIREADAIIINNKLATTSSSFQRIGGVKNIIFCLMTAWF